MVGTISTSSRNTEAELMVNAARASYPGNVSTELKLRSKKEMSITFSLLAQSYVLYEMREKTVLLYVILGIVH